MFLAWVSSFGVGPDLSWSAAGLPGFLPSFGGTLLPLSWPVPTAWLSRLLVFLEVFARVLSSRFQCLLIARGGCGWSLVIHPPWLGRGWCYRGFLSGPVGLPAWGCGASGLLGPAVLMVFAMGPPVSGWDCSSSVRDRDVALPSFWWVWFLAFMRGPLPQAGAVFFSMC